MTRRRKLILNSGTSLLYQLTTLICGFVLPRMFLSYYGSTVNGLVSSITQFLGFISLAECGVGAVVQSTLYRPLADRDNLEISKIVISSERFFKKIAYILIVYTAVLMVVYPILVSDRFNYVYTMVLIFVISISTFAQYYIGMTYRLLLSADQLGYIQYGINIVALILNTLSCVVLMRIGASIQIVKLATSLIFLMQPILISLIAKHKYRFERSIVLTDEPIQQKWNGLAQHIASVVLGNTDVVVLTMLSTLENVSVYTVYNLVVSGVKQIIVSLTNGVQSLFGNMLAKKEMQKINSTFDLFEWAMHTLVTLFFSITAALILPFVSVYTRGISDTNYIVPVFAYLITLAQASYCFRLPYNIMVLAAGHYKQTQRSAIVEAIINIVISVLLVFRFGLVGVAIGTLVAMIYRTCYLAYYLSKNIISRKIQYFLKHILVDITTVAVFFIILFCLKPFFDFTPENYFAWFILAIKTGALSGIIIMIVNFIFYRKTVVLAIQKIIKRIRKGKVNA